MPKYAVDLGREINPDHGYVVVKASDEEDARRVAMDMARAHSKAIEWTDGDEPIDTYVTDVSLVEYDTPVSVAPGDEQDKLAPKEAPDESQAYQPL